MFGKSLKLLAIYAGASWSLIEILNFACDKYSWPHLIIDIVIRMVFLAIPAVFIYTHFRQKETNRVYKSEIMLYSINMTIVLLFVIPLFLKSSWSLFGNGFQSYETAFFEERYQEVLSSLEDDRDSKNLKQNEYYILSDFYADFKISKETRAYYQKLLNNNEDSPEPYYYLSIIYLRDNLYVEEQDSVLILADKALDLGLDKIQMAIHLRTMYKQFNLPDNELTILPLLLNSNNPEYLRTASSISLSVKKDTISAVEILKKSIEIIPNAVSNINLLARIMIEKERFKEADSLLELALAYNPQAMYTINLLAEAKKEQGDFVSAKKIIRQALKDEGDSDKKTLSMLLLIMHLTQDSVEIGLNLLEEIKQKYGEDEDTYYVEMAFNQRKSWLETKKGTINQKELAWVSDYDEAVKLSQILNKPIFVDFYTTWCYWCKVLDQKVFTDTLVQRAMNDFVLLKVNAEDEIRLAKKYDIQVFPTLLVLDSEGNKFSKIDDYTKPNNLLTALESTLKKYNKMLRAQSIKDITITSASNLEDAYLLAKSKQFPIVAIVTDSRSSASQKMDDVLMDKEVQFNLSSFVNVNLDNSKAYRTEIIKPTVFPTIYFLNSGGEVLFVREGYLPKNEFMDLIEDVSDLSSEGKEIRKINWYYDFEEAKSIALLKNKKLFIASADSDCDLCNQMKTITYQDPEVVDLVNQQFIPLYLDVTVEEDLIEELNMSFPGMMIATESGKNLIKDQGFKSKDQLIKWMDYEEKLRMISLLGNKKFEEFNLIKNVADELKLFSLYRSATAQYTMLQEISPEDNTLNYMAAQCALKINENKKALDELRKAIQKGKLIDKKLLEELLIVFYRLENPRAFLVFLDNALLNAKSQEEEGLLLYGKSLYYYLEGENQQSLDFIKIANEKNPSYFIKNLYGILEYKSQNYDRAVALFNESNSLNQVDAEASLYLAKIATDKGQKSLSEAHIKDIFIKNRAADFELAQSFITRVFAVGINHNIRMLNQELFQNLLFLDQSLPAYLYLSQEQLLNHSVTDETLINLDKLIALEPDLEPLKWFRAWALISLNEKEGNEMMERLIAQTPEEVIDQEHFFLTTLYKYYQDIGNKNEQEKFANKIKNMRDFSPELQKYKIYVKEDQEMNIQQVY